MELNQVPSHQLRFAVNCSILFSELALLERPAAAKAAGFDAVEFWWPFSVAAPGDGEVDAFISAIEDAGVQLVGLNFFAGDMPGGDRGLVSWPARSAEFRENVAVVTAIGQATGCRCFNALYGNRTAQDEPRAQDYLGAENLAFAAAAIAELGGTVLVESVSGPQPYPLRTAADAIAVIDRALIGHGVRNLGFLADLYHLTVNGDDLDKVIESYASRVAHVQIADAPGRHEPGTGEIDLDRYLAKLERAGYQGWVGLEYLPSGSSADGFNWLPPQRRSTRAA
jgi:hydroxypyruvate isomerase